MDTVTRTFPIDLTSDYTPDSIIELCHFRDMAFDDDERVGVYLESFFCNLNLRSFNLGVFPDFDGDESEIEKMSLFNAAEAKSQKIGLRILFRKNNIGNWKKRAEIILVNRGRDDYFDLLQPYLAKNQVRIFEKNNALAIQLIDYNNGLLKPVDSLSIEAAFTITIAKKNSLEAFEARLALLELAIKDRINDIPPDSLLGREMGTGVVEVISQAKFATPAMLDQAITDLVGGIINQLTLKADANNPIITGIISNTGGRLQFPTTQVPSTDANTLDDYREGTFTPTVVGVTTAGVGTYSTQQGRYTRIGNIIIFNLFVEWTAHSGTGEIRVIGLPFLFAASSFAAATIWHRNLTLTANHTLQGHVAGASGAVGTIVISQVPTGGGFPIAVPMDAAAGLMISGSYTALN
jgi:hypothetical protein